jgi:rubrerythrin
MDDNKIHIADGEADTAVVAAWEADRRDLVRRGIALGGAAVAASSIPFLWSARNAFAQADGDAAILEAAVGLEQVAVFAYDAAAKSGKLGKATAVAELFRDQEQEHADGLITALESLGGMAPAKPMSVADIDKVLPGLGKANTAKKILEFAIELETAALAAYYDAHQKLRDGALLQTGASIMANEGQHLVVLRTAAGKPAVPNALETGTA